MKRKLEFLKQFFFIDDHTGKISHNKFWSNVGYAVMCFSFVYCVYTGKAEVDLWLVFGTLVMGNATANKVLKLKYGNKADVPPTTGEVK